ncbi:AraC family transcriptional regulator [Anaerocolumna xylanovorans]|uniref:AraC-type DNA-binding protein n=1 Tax=Anaerocolumna xylanovorans DSM 12503 TaxID=1121345 RepID=A0A1M7YL75_9FIRM|nr:AraC family transcriptional regulator [Anaerocolumna xylanovorans]SHO53346.1 AraC-type DNA-binding protein [Anaerocolumna xylanovorans DSM 12503]
MEQTYYIEKRNPNAELPRKFSVHTQEKKGPGVMVHAHIHDYIEILYAQSGQFRILLNNKDYTFGEGDMVLINSNEIHNVFSQGEAFNQYICIKFEPEMLYTSQSLLEMKYLMPFILKESTHQKIFTKEEIKATILPSILHDINTEYKESRYGFELAIRADILTLFLYILRNWHKQDIDLNIDVPINKEMEKQLKKVFDYIEDNYQKDITVREMAKYCHMSYSYFSRMFKKVMKKSFKEYLTYVRILKAEKLLISTNSTITEIALETGFTTSSYFISQFKELKNISPKQYRKNYMTN